MAQHMAQQNTEGSRDLSTLVDASAELQHLVQTIWRLRQPDGCPWDREQTHRSIGKNMIEEAYEALDCIEADDVAHLREELGDVLMQVVLHAQIAADAGEFTLVDVAHDIDAKLIRRHPHVFGDADADSSDEVLKIWDEVKLAEKAAKDKAVAAGEAAPEGLLDGVPTHLPALMQAQKVSRKAAAVGFEWETVQDVWDEVAEERAEFEAEAPGSPEREMEFGDLLFALVNVARKEGIDAESALRASTAKFRRRWAAMEQMAADAHVDLAELSTHGLNDLWDAAKAESKTAGATGRTFSSPPLFFKKIVSLG
ncbi:nucleoside triphosphate pyrophosphohydrolase [Collinsella sp. TF07-1]|uniref:nucleoside triphosphate pyrophosphohydrolase n=1 Tax=Collinsella sp. TF07-1 TaxID=2292332 RepID=UPI001F2BE66A|nr:nucleoside triphosphate pyrophosphohydrolase [Collinsella sp. TF07-1]